MSTATNGFCACVVRRCISRAAAYLQERDAEQQRQSGDGVRLALSLALGNLYAAEEQARALGGASPVPPGGVIGARKALERGDSAAAQSAVLRLLPLVCPSPASTTPKTT